jgi:hypothetical protein
MQVIERRVSFNGGEWSPWADARLDLDRYRSSCRTLENMRPTTYGGAFSRPGLVYIGDQDGAGDLGRVVPFEFSADTNLVLVFTDKLMRPFTTGATPAKLSVDMPATWVTPKNYKRGDWVEWMSSSWYCLEDHDASAAFHLDQYTKWEMDEYFKLATPYAADELAELQFAQLNDLVYITHPNHAPRVLSRLANHRWTLSLLDLEYPPLRDENISATTIDPTNNIGTVTLLASAGIFNAGHIGSRWLIKHRRDEPFVELNVKTGTLSPALMVLGSWSCTIMTGEGTGNWDVTAVVQRSTDKVTWETIRTIAASRQDRSSLITGTELDPCWLRVKKISESGTSYIPANGNWKLEAVDPDHYGLVEITGYTSATSATAKVLFELYEDDADLTPATRRWAEAAWSDYRGWPRSVCIHDQRLVFGGNKAQPQHVWASIIDDFGNFRTGANDDLGLALYNANQKSNAVQWLVSRGDLIIGTAGAEGPLERLDTAKSITPTNVKFGSFTQIGSKHLQAIAAQDAVLFVSRNGRKVWELAFAFESDGYKANDLTLLAEHITDESITGIALQKNPETVLWCVTASGELLGLLYERNQQVAGWFRYVTAGAFESVAVVPGTGEADEVWVTVRREMNGSTVRYLERFQPDRTRLLKDAAGSEMIAKQSRICCADSAITSASYYDGVAGQWRIGGLARLEGMEVCVLADGSPLANQTVSGGKIIVDGEIDHAIIGLPYTCTLSPTWFETGDPATVSKVAWKCISKVSVHLWRTLGCEIGTHGSDTWESLSFTPQGVVMDQALPLFTGLKEARVSSSSEQQAAVVIRQTQPLPLNVLALHTFHEMNGIS